MLCERSFLSPEASFRARIKRRAASAHAVIQTVSVKNRAISLSPPPESGMISGCRIILGRGMLSVSTALITHLHRPFHANLVAASLLAQCRPALKQCKQRPSLGMDDS